VFYDPYAGSVGDTSVFHCLSMQHILLDWNTIESSVQVEHTV
jgi:hypothetical protein